MSFISIQFAFFLIAAVIGFHFCAPRYRALYLLLASYAFYVYSSPIAAIGIFLATLFTFSMGPLIQPARAAGSSLQPNRRAMALAVTLLLLYLSLFKILAALGLPSVAHLPDWTASASGGVFILPLGISYYTFKLISYVIDVYWDNVAPEKDFVDFAAYVVFFPQIVAGPIQRSADFLRQIRKPAPTREMMTRGLRRLLMGCFKKTVIADNLAVLIDTAYLPSSGMAIWGFYLFPLQLYADFSALTDIAIGAALLFGIESPENFNAPYLATNISEYWRRWHMTLTNWLGDYVFMPLRMATRSWATFGLVFSLMVNMILIGLWHNLSWTFLVFGVIHGIFLSADALTAKKRSKFFKTHPAWNRAANWAGPVITFHMVALAMVFVRATSLANAWSVLSGVLTPAPDWIHAALQTKETLYGLAGLALWFAIYLAARLPRLQLAGLPVWGRWAFYYAIIGIIIKCGHNAEGFIYFKF